MLALGIPYMDLLVPLVIEQFKFHIASQHVEVPTYPKVVCSTMLKLGFQFSEQELFNQNQAFRSNTFAHIRTKFLSSPGKLTCPLENSGWNLTFLF